MKLATAEQMRKLDTTAITDYHIPGIVLMENAGAGAVRAMLDYFAELNGATVAIIIGPGNNGGDGLVMARHLYQMGALPELFFLIPPAKLKGDAGINLAIVNELPIPSYLCTSPDELHGQAAAIQGADLIIDAIFGTGLTRKVSGHFVQAIDIINQSASPVIAVDIPSGLAADTGSVLGAAVQADLTVTFALPKPAHILEISQQSCGELVIIDISIPPEAIDEANLHLEVINRHTVAAWLPSRPLNAHKGSFGHLLIVAGAAGKTGAAIMCGQGALRSGAGLVSLALPKAAGIVQLTMPEVMTIPLRHSTDFLDVDDFEQIHKETASRQAMAMGPGTGTAAATEALIKKLYAQTEIPLVVDADALNILAEQTAMLKEAPAPRILTPHPGEMARLCGRTVGEIQADRINIGRDFAVHNNIYLVLKGARTIIAAPDGRVAINPTGNPAMAAGGMGDILTGVIGGLLAQGLSPWQAACTGVYCHGLAGDLLIADRGSIGSILASDLAAEIPTAMNAVQTDD